jgi:hypothetical protein
MTFASPLFLLAALAGLLPVVLHLVHRRKAKELPFSTLRFLKISVQRTRRRKYIEDVALLVLRILVLFLIALGLARPVISSLPALWGGGRAAAIAIVLDNSASMATSDAGRPRFESAREAARQILARLHTGDLVALLPTSGPLRPEHGRLFRSHETVRAALDECQPSFERADLATKIEQARGLLQGDDAPSKEIYVFTDNQALSWEGLKAHAEEAETARQSAAAKLPVIVVNVAREPAPNVALRTVTLDSVVPVVGAPFEATVELQSTATVLQQKHLELVIDDIKETVSPTLNIAPGAIVKQTFHFTFDRAGPHRGVVRVIETDSSPMDNRLYFAATIDQQIPLAIVKPRLDLVPEADDAFYLERALAPNGPEDGTFRLTTLTPESLETARLAGQSVIFCVNVSALSPQPAEKLREYVHGGGHVVWICGRNVQPVAYNAMNALAQGQLLPASVDELRRPLPGGVEGWHIGFLDKDDQALAPLSEPTSLYQSVLVYQYFPMKWTAHTAPRILAKLDDGQALLTERVVGNGSVLFLGTDAHVDWTNLPLKPLFLPLVARLTFQLAGVENARTMALAGAAVTIPLETGRSAGSVRRAEIEVTRPSGEVVRIREVDRATGAYRYADTHEAGVYIARQVDRNPSKQFAFAVNIDPAESDPALLTRAELQARFGQQPIVFCDEPADLPGAMARLHEGTSLWEWFLAAVLIALVFEVFLANRSAAMQAEPSGALAAPQPPHAIQEPTPETPAEEVYGFLRGLEQTAAENPLRDGD